MVTCWHFKNWSVWRQERKTWSSDTNGWVTRDARMRCRFMMPCWEVLLVLKVKKSSVSRHKTRAKEKRHAEKQRCNTKRKKDDEKSTKLQSYFGLLNRCMTCFIIILRLSFSNWGNLTSFGNFLVKNLDFTILFCLHKRSNDSCAS